MTATVKKRIDHLYEGELRRWREAWIAFWTDVWRPITDHELELASTVPRDDKDKERWPEVQAVVIEDCTAWEPDEAEAWVQWAHAMDAFLEQCPDEEFLQHTYEMVPSSADSRIEECCQVPSSLSSSWGSMSGPSWKAWPAMGWGPAAQ